MINPFEMSAGGLISATTIVIITTLEDCLWLVPFVTTSSRTTGLLHAAVFIMTFEGLALAISVATVLLGESLTIFGARSDLILGILGAALCWGLAIFLFVRARQKQQRRRAKDNEEQQALVENYDEEQRSSNYGSTASDADPHGYKRGNSNDDPLVEILDSEDDRSAWVDMPPATLDPQPWLIITLTVLGSLDEVSYFPALILGDIVTPADLCVATFLASVIILTVLYLALTPCQPFLEILDRIPLYYIVGFFAVALTLEVVLTH